MSHVEDTLNHRCGHSSMSVTSNAPTRDIDDICPECRFAQLHLRGQEDHHEPPSQQVPIQASRPPIQTTGNTSLEARYRLRSCRSITRENFGLFLEATFTSNAPTGPIFRNTSDVVLRAKLAWMGTDELSNEDTTCEVCLAANYVSAMFPEDRRVVLPCGHKVGAACLKTLFRQSTCADLTAQSLQNFLICPSCNTPIMRIRSLNTTTGRSRAEDRSRRLSGITNRIARMNIGA